MRMTYGPEAKAAYVYFVQPIKPGEAVRQVMALDGGVVLDLDAEGRLLGVEIIYADRLLRPETLMRAQMRSPRGRRSDPAPLRNLKTRRAFPRA